MLNKKFGFEAIAERLGNDMDIHCLCLFLHDLLTEFQDM